MSERKRGRKKTSNSIHQTRPRKDGKVFYKTKSRRIKVSREDMLKVNACSELLSCPQSDVLRIGLSMFRKYAEDNPEFEYKPPLFNMKFELYEHDQKDINWLMQRYPFSSETTCFRTTLRFVYDFLKHYVELTQPKNKEE
jgi:hypothetical protein